MLKNLAYFLGFWTELNLEKNIISFKKKTFLKPNLIF